VIRERVIAGMPYLGASAGSNVAGPTILTTNDWNVVALDRFDALGLVSFNINPHYKETDPTMAPGSETRDDRIAEYHVVNANPVVGLEGGRARPRRAGSGDGARYRAGQDLPAWPGANLARGGGAARPRGLTGRDPTRILASRSASFRLRGSRCRSRGS
jgi:Peptidase E